MASLNLIIITGNLGNDPEMRRTRGDKVYTTFNVATNFTKTSLDGERQQHTEWFSVFTYDCLAEQCNQFLAKGKTVQVIGRIHLNRWEDGEGKMKCRNEIRANQVIFLDKPSDNNGESEED